MEPKAHAPCYRTEMEWSPLAPIPLQDVYRDASGPGCDLRRGYYVLITNAFPELTEADRRAGRPDRNLWVGPARTPEMAAKRAASVVRSLKRKGVK